MGTLTFPSFAFLPTSKYHRHHGEIWKAFYLLHKLWWCQVSKDFMKQTNIEERRTKLMKMKSELLRKSSSSKHETE